jgi:hypothetical protein
MVSLLSSEWFEKPLVFCLGTVDKVDAVLQLLAGMFAARFDLDVPDRELVRDGKLVIVIDNDDAVAFQPEALAAVFLAVVPGNKGFQHRPEQRQPVEPSA